MPPARTARRPVNDENAENVGTTRLTRAKAAALDSVPVGDPPKKVLASKRTNSTTNTVLGTRKRTALGDVSNVAKAQEPTDAKKDTLGKGTLSKSAKPVGIQKQPTRAGSTRGVLNARPTTSTELKKRASSNTNGHVAKKRVAASETKLVIEDENAGDYDDENDFAENVAPSKAKVEDQGVTHGKKLKDAITPQRSYNVKSDPEFEEDDELPYEEIVKDAKDLDAEDVDDPLMVAEYVHEIFDYMKELEISTMPNHNYMDNQNELEWKMRGILVDWLLEVHTRFRLLPETLFLAVNIIDRFLSSKVVQLERLQLVGVTAMFIASKYEEVLSPHVQNFVHVADDGFKDTEILSAERFILTTLDYDLSYPNPMNFLRRISKADNYDIQTRTLGKYLLEIGCLDHRFLQYAPSHVAAASMYLSRLALDRGEWDATLTKYAGYTEAEIQPVFKLMVEYLSSPVVHEAFFRKYASKKFLKASIVLRQWAKKWAPKYLDDASLLSSSGKTPRS